jgi:hypothetical protein
MWLGQASIIYGGLGRRVAERPMPQMIALDRNTKQQNRSMNVTIG